MRQSSRPLAVAAALAISALGIGVLAPTSGQTQEASEASIVERLNGRWQLTRGESTARQTVERAIEQATDGMLPIVRGFAERELRVRNPVNGAFTIDITPQRIRTVFARGTYESAPGHPLQTRVPDADEEMQLVQLVREGRLEQVFTTDRGRRWSLFVPSEDGEQLTMRVVVSAGMLPRELRYELDYRRAR